MKIIYYDNGARPVEAYRSPLSSIVEVVSDDDRTVQVSFDNQGNLNVRAWGNKPARLGNWDNTSFSAIVQFEKPNTCEKCFWKLEECKCK